MMLWAWPPSIVPRDSTAVLKGERLRLTIVCRLWITAAAMTMASTDSSGAAQWAEVPWTRMVSSSEAAFRSW